MRVLELRLHAAALRGIGLIAASTVLGACAHGSWPLQQIDVQVMAEDGAWSGTLLCEARNAVGTWRFMAPGAVVVVRSASPLEISCFAQSTASVDPSVTPVQGSADRTPVDNSAKPSAKPSTKTGAVAGAGTGVALGVAAAPVMGPTFAVAMILGSTLTGAQVGAVAGGLTADTQLAYPKVVVLQLRTQP